MTKKSILVDRDLNAELIYCVFKKKRETLIVRKAGEFVDLSKFEM